MYFGGTVGKVPFVRTLEEGVLESLTFGYWHLVVLMSEPAVPFGRYHVTVGTTDRKIVIIFDPSRLVVI